MTDDSRSAFRAFASFFTARHTLDRLRSVRLTLRCVDDDNDTATTSHFCFSSLPQLSSFAIMALPDLGGVRQACVCMKISTRVQPLARLYSVTMSCGQGF
jgi:hypothetical protein